MGRGGIIKSGMDGVYFLSLHGGWTMELRKGVMIMCRLVVGSKIMWSFLLGVV
jgi:hypothetical protein